MDGLFAFGDRCLPHDIMHKIMSKFSAEELCAICLVSKNWRSSIRNRNFIAYYNKYCEENDERHLITIDFGYSPSPSRIFITISRRYIQVEEWHQLLPCSGRVLDLNICIVGSINGILCLKAQTYTKKIVFKICNPVAGQLANVQPPSNI